MMKKYINADKEEESLSLFFLWSMCGIIIVLLVILMSVNDRRKHR